MRRLSDENGNDCCHVVKEQQHLRSMQQRCIRHQQQSESRQQMCKHNERNRFHQIKIVLTLLLTTIALPTFTTESFSFHTSTKQYSDRSSALFGKKPNYSKRRIQKQQRNDRIASPLFGTYSYSSNDNNKAFKKEKIRSSSSSSSKSSSSKNTSTTTTVSTPTITKEELVGVVDVTSIAKDVVAIDMIISSDVTLQSYDDACKQLSQGMHFPGFKNGAILPHNLVELIHGKTNIQLQAVSTIITEQITKYAEKALRYYEYDPVLENSPRLTIPIETIAETLYKPGEALSFTIECDVIPEPEPEPEPEPIIIEEDVIYDTFQDDRRDYSYDSYSVDEILVESDSTADSTAWNEELLKSMDEEYADLVEVDETYQLRQGDACDVQMVGYKLNPDGTLGLPLPSMIPQNAKKSTNVLGDRVKVLLKGGKYMPGLVEGLIGMKKGDKITLFVNFPKTDEYGPLAGQEISYDVEVLQSYKRDGSKPSVFY